MSEQTSGAVPDAESLRRLLSGLKDLPPKVRTGTRRDLRGVGSDVIKEQRGILSGPLPSGTTKVGFTHKVVHARRKGKFFVVKKNLYEDAEVKRKRPSRGMRDKIAAGLRTRVATGARYQGIDIQTTGPRAGDPKFNQAKFWNKGRFRHPVFGNRAKYVDQKGQPYFFGPVIRGRDEMVRRAGEILARTVDEI